MDHIAAAIERIVNERLRHKFNEVNVAAQSHLSGVQDHLNFTLWQAYFKCAYECFDRRNKQDEINNCVEQCSVPVLNAQNLVETETAKFQYGLVHIAAGDLLRAEVSAGTENGKLAKEYMEKEQLVPNEIVVMVASLRHS